jgi:glycosyltransferase involved in cell wall biosynthesis
LTPSGDLQIAPQVRLRVCVVAPFGVLGGAEGWLLRLLDATTELEPQAILLADGPLRGELERRGIPVRVRAIGRTAIQQLRAMRWLRKELRRQRPDVVLANGVKAALAAIPACRLARVPIVWAKHDHAFDAQLARPLGLVADRVVAAVEELGAPTHRSDLIIVPPPRPESPPANRQAARAFWASRGVVLDDTPTLVMAGRLVPYKGVDEAIRALTLPGGKHWRLVVIGDDDPSAPTERERLERLAADLQVHERVQLLGPIPGLSRWLAAFDALAVLTKPDARVKGEGFGTSAFEAMLAGVPIIAVTGGAVVRRLEGRAGIGVPAGDAGAVADALAVYTSAASRRRAGKVGQELVRSHPTSAECADLLVRTLRDAVEVRRGARTLVRAWPAARRRIH